MNDFEPESDGFSDRIAESVHDLRPPLGLEAGILSRLDAEVRKPKLSPRNQSALYRAALAAAAVIVVGGVGVVGLNVMTGRLTPAISSSDRVDRLASAESRPTPLDFKSTLRDSSRRELAADDSYALPTDKEDAAKSLSGQAYQLPVVAAKNSDAVGLGYGLVQTERLSSLAANKSADADASVQAATGLISHAKDGQNAFDSAADVNRSRGGFGGGGLGGEGGYGGRGGARGRGRAIAMATPPGAPAEKLPADEAPTAPATAAAIADRKIIRSGDMQFEVESFDAAYQRLVTIVQESHGYIGATESQRLPNGKVQGRITVRVPPENLDVLVLKLRALGDLKSQQINAEDITREFTDLQSQLRAAKAMEDRLMEIVKTAHASVKDLLAAENELAVWREKDETLTGQINYDNNRVALSTLAITLTEKDINQAATAHEEETISAGLEADDVSRARDEVFKAVDAAKGRIIEAELNQRQAGEFMATITATVPPDAAGGVIDRLRQLGRITRLQSARRQTTTGEPAAPELKVKREDTVLRLSIFNVAAYAARTTDNLSVACDNVETSYHALLEFIKKSDGGRVVNSNLARPTPDSATGVVVFEVKESSADAMLAYIRASGTVLQLNVVENADSDNVTTTKRAFSVTLNPLANIAPQETDELTLLPVNSDLPQAYHRLVDFANNPASHARVVDKDLQQENGVYTNAFVIMEVPRATLAEAQEAIAEAGKIVARKATRQADSPNVVDSKVLLRFSFVNVDALQPRQTLNRDLAAADVGGAYQAILDAVQSAGGKVRTAQLIAPAGQRDSAVMEFDLPVDKQPAVQAVIDRVSMRFGGTVVQAPENQVATDAMVRMHLQIAAADALTPLRTYQLEIQTPAPEAAAADVIAAAQAAGGTVAGHSTNVDSAGAAGTHVIVDVPLDKAGAIVDAARGKGVLLRDDSTDNPQAPTGPAARAHVEFNFASEPGVVADNNGLTATLKQGLVTSVRGLLWSLEMLVIGICLIGPWAAVVWAGWRWMRRKTR